MLLPLLLFAITVSAPEPDEIDVDDIPEAPKPCTIDWAPKHDKDFIEITQDRISRRCTELLQALDYDAEPESVHIDIGGDMPDFTARVSITHDGEILYDSGVSAEICTSCGPNDLTIFTAKHVAVAIEELRTPAETPPPESPPKHGGDQPSQPPPPPAKHGLRWAGLSVGALGIVLGVTGGVLMPRRREGRAFEDRDIGTATTRRHPLPLTATLVGLGAGAVVAGVVMVVLDAKKTKNTRRATVAPSIAPAHVALTLTGKF